MWTNSRKTTHDYISLTILAHTGNFTMNVNKFQVEGKWPDTVQILEQMTRSNDRKRITDLKSSMTEIRPYISTAFKGFRPSGDTRYTSNSVFFAIIRFRSSGPVKRPGI